MKTKNLLSIVLKEFSKKLNEVLLDSNRFVFHIQ